MSVRRLDILNAVHSRLNTVINGIGGYYNNLVGKVFLYKQDSFQDHQLPALNIRRSLNLFPEEVGKTITSKSLQNLNLDIELVCESASTTYSIAEKIIADVYKAIGTDPTWGGLATDTIPIKDEVIIDKQEGENQLLKIVGGGIINIQIAYRTNEWSES